jgi:hypothetical protein
MHLAGDMSTSEAVGPQGAPTPAGYYLVAQQLVALLTTGAAGDMLLCHFQVSNG